MATTLVTDIPIFVFSSQLQEVEFTTDLDEIVISVENGTTEMFRTSLYSFDGRVTLINIGEVLETYMQNNNLVFTAFTLYYNDTAGNNLGSFNLNTLYCSHILETDEAGIFASYNFLTTLKSRRVPAHSTVPLSFLHGQEDTALKAHCVFATDDGTTANAIVSLERIIADDIGVRTVFIKYDTIVELLTADGYSVTRLMAYTIEYNNRFCSFYVVDYSPEMVFTFKNCFNVDETVYLNAITTVITKVNRSLVVSQGRNSFYDQTTDKTYEVQSSSLTAQEAEWIEQLFISHSVRLGVSDDIATLPQVLITECTCEIADNDEEPNKVKFTWQYVEQRPHLSIPTNGDGCFTKEYNHVYK